MTLQSDLMGLGMATGLAARMGHTPAATVVGSGTAQRTDAAAITAESLLALGLNVVTTAAGQTAVQIPASMPVGSELLINVTTATAALAFPPSAGTVNGGAADASFSIAQNKPTRVTRWTAVIFTAELSA